MISLKYLPREEAAQTALYLLPPVDQELPSVSLTCVPFQPLARAQNVQRTTKGLSDWRIRSDASEQNTHL